MISATSKTTGNSELGNLRLQWVQDNWELWKKTSSVLNGHPTRNSKTGTRTLSRALTWRSQTSWFYLIFFQISSCLESTINPENARIEWQSLMRKYAHKGPLCHLPVQVSTVQQVQICLVCCCINYVICQWDMYTVAKEVTLSVCCVVSC